MFIMKTWKAGILELWCRFWIFKWEQTWIQKSHCIMNWHLVCHHYTQETKDGLGKQRQHKPHENRITTLNLKKAIKFIKYTNCRKSSRISYATMACVVHQAIKHYCIAEKMPSFKMPKWLIKLFTKNSGITRHLLKKIWNYIKAQNQMDKSVQYSCSFDWEQVSDS